MQNMEPTQEVWTREDAIGRIRIGLLKLSDGEHSMCHVAAELRVFCHGFRRWSDEEFLRRWTKVVGRSTHLNRPQMEQLADLWQLTEQVRLRVPLACDAQTVLRGACRGWNEFSNKDLERCCSEILGRNVVVQQPNEIAQNAHAFRQQQTLDSTRCPGSNLGPAHQVRHSELRPREG